MKQLQPIEIKVNVSVTLTKSVTIKVSDYKIDKHLNADNIIYDTINYSKCDLIKAVKKQITLPHKAYLYITTYLTKYKIIKDLKNWNLNEVKVTKK